MTIFFGQETLTVISVATPSYPCSSGSTGGAWPSESMGTVWSRLHMHSWPTGADLHLLAGPFLLELWLFQLSHRCWSPAPSWKYVWPQPNLLHFWLLSVSRIIDWSSQDKPKTFLEKSKQWGEIQLHDFSEGQTVQADYSWFGYILYKCSLQTSKSQRRSWPVHPGSPWSCSAGSWRCSSSTSSELYR